MIVEININTLVFSILQILYKQFSGIRCNFHAKHCYNLCTGDIQKDDIKFDVSSNSSAITIHWNFGRQADSMIQAGFITDFQYFIVEGEQEKKYTSSKTSHTFSNLTAGHTYSVYGKVITTDTSSVQLQYDAQTLTLPNGLYSCL